MGHYGDYDYVVVNEDLEACVSTVVGVVKAARARVSRMARGREPGARDISGSEGDLKRMANMPQLILAKDVDSKFRFITVAAQRAKQLQNGAKPRVEVRSRKSTRVAIDEVVAGAVSWEVKDEIPPAPVVA